MQSMKLLYFKVVGLEEAKEKIGSSLFGLQFRRNSDDVEKYREDIKTVGLYLFQKYLDNVWPETSVNRGTCQGHLGHQYADDGYGCFRCHDEEHENNSGKVISQSCDLCHDDPDE